MPYTIKGTFSADKFLISKQRVRKSGKTK
jgi:hypothetical protein